MSNLAISLFEITVKAIAPVVIPILVERITSRFNKGKTAPIVSKDGSVETENDK